VTSGQRSVGQYLPPCTSVSSVVKKSENLHATEGTEKRRLARKDRYEFARRNAVAIWRDHDVAVRAGRGGNVS
jgi:hypothetical protein